MRPTYLFDLDGTLVDSSEPIFRSLNHALDVHGMEPMPRDELWRYVGPPLQSTLHDLLTSRGEDPGLVADVIDAYRESYRVVSIDLAELYPGIDEVIDALADDVRLGIVTSKPLAFALPIVEALNFTQWFDVIEGPGDTETETKIVTLGRALGRLAVEPVHHPVTMIGDRRHDVEAGLALGTGTVGVTWGFGDRAELESAGAHTILDRPAQILDLGSIREPG